MNYIMLMAALIVTFSLIGCSVGPSNISTAPAVNAIQPTPSPEIADPEPDWHKAVRLAEEFIARNGYTDAPADKNNLTKESIEYYGDVDEMLESRHNTLESKAYGVSPPGHMSAKGWIVGFRHKDRTMPKKLSAAEKRVYHSMGRAVTMDVNFENLRVEHKDYPVDNAAKKLNP